MSEQPIADGEELWTFGGSRVGSGNARRHAWLPDTADLPERPLTVKAVTDAELWYRARGSYVVGGQYRVRVSRNGDHVSMYPNPTYAGRDPDQAVRETLEALHRAAEVRLQMYALERADSRRSEIAEALVPLQRIAGRLRTQDRAAFTAYVLEKMWQGPA